MADLSHASTADAVEYLPTALAQLLAVVADPMQRHALAAWQERVQAGLNPEDRARLGIELSQFVEDRRLPDEMRRLAVDWTLRLLGAHAARTWGQGHGDVGACETS